MGVPSGRSAGTEFPPHPLLPPASIAQAVSCGQVSAQSTEGFLQHSVVKAPHASTKYTACLALAGISRPAAADDVAAAPADAPQRRQCSGRDREVILLGL